MKSTLKEQTKLFLGSKQNANLLPEILASLYAKGGPDLLQSVRCFQSIFNEIIQRGDFNYEVHAVGSPEYEYSQWLRERYIEGIENLTEIMQTNGSTKLRDIGIDTLFSFNELEYENSGKFPKIDHSLIVRLIEAFLHPVSQLIENSAKQCEFLKSFKVRMEFTHSLKNILEVCSKSTTKPQEEWMRNVLKLCRTILKAETSAVEPSTDDSSKDTVSNERKNFKRVFSKLWSFVMKWDQTTPAIVRQIVTMLPDHVMEHLDRPILMSDYLLESFKIGGPIGILALRGIFILMIKYNFDVPDFYTKLYSLFELPVLYSNYRTRFFRYADSFLASTHLPEYLIAAFVKKLSRMSLHAPAPAIPLMCHFIVNLMIKHPGLKVLIHNTTPKASGSISDPFDDKEGNPNKTQAMESSLWEMKTLQNHILPSVAQACAFIEKPLPTVSFDLEEDLQKDYDDMFEEEVLKRGNIAPVEPKKLDPFDFTFSHELLDLSESIHSLSRKRRKVC